MKRTKMIILLLTLALGLAGCSGDGTLENGPEVTYEMAEPRLLDGERQEILRVPVEEDCKAMLHYTYTTADADGAVLWLENDVETLRIGRWGRSRCALATMCSLFRRRRANRFPAR